MLKLNTQFLNFQIGLGLAAVVGHIFPIWAHFRGGKGDRYVIWIGARHFTDGAVCCVGVFLLVLYLTRFVSLSSILASVAFPVFIFVIFNVPNINLSGFRYRSWIDGASDTSKKY